MVSEILFLEQVGICLDRTGGSSAEKEGIQCCGGMFPLKATSCVPGSSSARIGLGQLRGWDSSVPWGVEPLGKEGSLGLQGPESPPREGGGAGRWGPLCMVWLDKGPTAPCSHCPSPSLSPASPACALPSLPSCGGWHVAGGSPRCAVPCGEDALTSQGVLGHTEAQGLQPVVDVRFSHGKLEFCKGQRVPLVTGALRARRK